MRCFVRALLLVLASAASALAGGWQFERVDSIGATTDLQLRRLPDGRLCLLYSHPTAGLRYAVKDTVWHYEDIPDSGDFGFSVSPAGVPGVLCRGRYIERTDTGWVYESVPWAPSYPLLAHDSAGSPVYLLLASVPDTQMLIAASRVGSVWQQDTAVRLALPYEGLGAGGLRSDALGRLFVLFGYHEMSGYTYYQYLNVAVRTDSGWVRHGAASTQDGSIGPSALGVDNHGGWGAVSIVTGYLIDYWLWYAQASGGGRIFRASPWTELAVTFDSLRRPRIAYLQNEHPLLAWRDSTTWDTLHVPWNYSVSSIDVVTTDRGEPIMAMSTRNGVWLARADRVLGCGETSERMAAPHLTGTLCRGILNLAPGLCHPATRVVLLDVSGREVMSLLTGPNDISCLPAGVYHVRTRDGTLLERVTIVR